MHTPQLFGDILVIFLVSVPVAFLCLRLKLPLLVGFMLTGIGIGPYGLGLVRELEGIEILAEIGVMLLLFTIGLEFSLKRLREMKTLVTIGGGLQVLITIAVTAGAAIMAGRGLGQAIFFGYLVALSSTAIVLKSYVDRNQVDSPHGRAAVGILLFQDISIVFMLLTVPLLSGQDVESFSSIILSLGQSLIALVVIVLAAWFLLPKFLKRVVQLRSTEVFLLTVVLLCLGMSWVTSHFGLSLALGAFIAGVVLADSEYSHQVTTEVLPFRDVFNSLFFVSIGMLLSLSALAANLLLVAAVVLGLVLMKTLVVFGIIRLLGFPTRIAVMAGLAIAQIGEFSFVLAKTGRGFGLLSDGDYQVFLAASIISMIATPFVIAAAPACGYFLQSAFSKSEVEVDDAPIHETQTGDALKNHVIIVGYGLNGRNLARVLRSVEVPYIILELNGEVVKKGRTKGDAIMFGDATRREVLSHAGVKAASNMVLAMSDPQAARRTVRQARQMNPKIHIIVRTRYVSEITELFELGANEVIPEEFETSIEIFSRVLHQYGIPRNVIEEQIDKIRRQGYEMLRSVSPGPVHLGNLNSVLQNAFTETIRLASGSPVIGKTLGELDIRNQSGATIIAVVRDGEAKINPGSKYTLAEGDILILLGSAKRIEKAAKIFHPAGEIGGFNA